MQFFSTSSRHVCMPPLVSSLVLYGPFWMEVIFSIWCEHKRRWALQLLLDAIGIFRVYPRFINISLSRKLWWAQRFNPDSVTLTSSIEPTTSHAESIFCNIFSWRNHEFNTRSCNATSFAWNFKLSAIHHGWGSFSTVGLPDTVANATRLVHAHVCLHIFLCECVSAHACVFVQLCS